MLEGGEPFGTALDITGGDTSCGCGWVDGPVRGPGVEGTPLPLMCGACPSCACGGGGRECEWCACGSCRRTSRSACRGVCLRDIAGRGQSSRCCTHCDAIRGETADGGKEIAGEEGRATGARRARGGVVYKWGERDKIRANKKAIRDRRLRVCDRSEDGRTLARVSSAPRACLPLPDRRASDALGSARRLSQVHIEIQIFLNYAPRPATLVPYLLSLIRSLPRCASTAAARPSMSPSFHLSCRHEPTAAVL